MSNVKKDIKYLGKDFGQFRRNLIEFAKTYYPNTFNDFNESDPGLMFIEQSAYVGDVLSYYIDVALKEALFTEASERTNIFSHSRAKGYKPKNAIPATVDLDVFQLVPAKGTGDNIRPDYSYALRIVDGMVVGSKSDSNVEFRTLEAVDFAYSSSYSPTEVNVYQVNGDEPEYYLLKKSVKAVSGRVVSSNFSFGNAKKYDKIVLTQEGITEVVDIIDDDGNKWYEVPYLAQETIIESVENIAKNDNSLYVHRDAAPYLLNVKKVSRRYITNVTSKDNIEIQFGAGISSDFDEDLVPNPDLVGSELFGVGRSVSENIDPSNFLKTRSYGLAPSNTTLTVSYAIGGGVRDNVPIGDLTKILSLQTSIEERSLDSVLLSFVRDSVQVSNPKPASGGKSKDTEEEIKMNAMANFSTQDRAVTKEDYIIRAYAMPQRFGSVAKAYVVQDDQLNRQINEDNNTGRIINPYGINLYTLGYDSNQRLTVLNDAIKTNLKNYINHYRMMTDSINIKDAYIINIGVDFEIITRPNYNSNEVLIRCISRLKEYFDITKWQINQPISIGNISTELDKIEGVQTVTDVNIINYWDESLGYSGNIYNIETSIRDNILYPSMDPSIFEVKYPDTDIKGRVKAFGG